MAVLAGSGPGSTWNVVVASVVPGARVHRGSDRPRGTGRSFHVERGGTPARPRREHVARRARCAGADVAVRVQVAGTGCLAWGRRLVGVPRGTPSELSVGSSRGPGPPSPTARWRKLGTGASSGRMTGRRRPSPPGGRMVNHGPELPYGGRNNRHPDRGRRTRRRGSRCSTAVSGDTRGHPGGEPRDRERTSIRPRTVIGSKDPRRGAHDLTVRGARKARGEGRGRVLMERTPVTCPQPQEAVVRLRAWPTPAPPRPRPGPVAACGRGGGTPSPIANDAGSGLAFASTPSRDDGHGSRHRSARRSEVPHGDAGGPRRGPRGSSDGPRTARRETPWRRIVRGASLGRSAVPVRGACGCWWARRPSHPPHSRLRMRSRHVEGRCSARSSDVPRGTKADAGHRSHRGVYHRWPTDARGVPAFRVRCGGARDADARSLGCRYGDRCTSAGPADHVR